MARGRFISAKISESEQFADLETHEARLMFLMMLPHADVEGRLKADSRYLAGKIFTYLDFSHEQIEVGLADLERAELLRSYSVKGRRYVVFPKFAEHQVGLRKDREQPSEIPPPEEADPKEAPSETQPETKKDEARSYSGVTPEEVPPKFKVKSKLKSKEEVKDKEPPPTPPKSKKQKGQTHDFDPETVELPENFDRERFVDFCAMRLQKKDPMTALALKNFIRVNRNYSAPVLNRMFDNAIVPGWKALYPLKPWEQEEAERTPVVTPESERPPAGSRVSHPNWGVNTIRFYYEDGQMVLNESGALVWPHEVVQVPDSTPLGYESCPN